MRKLLNRIRRDTSGSAAVMLAISAPPLLGIAAVSIDLASLYLAERKLQGVADAAAAAAASTDIVDAGQGAAQRVLDRSRLEGAAMYSFTPGHYSRDPAIDFEDRFEPNDNDVNAAEVVLTQQRPLFFASVFMGNQSSQVAARARAARSDLVAFELGTKLLSLSGGMPNALLSQLAGAELNLSDEDIARLAASEIDIVAFADRLRAIQGEPSRTFGEVFDAESGVDAVIEAMAAASSDPETQALLSDIAAGVGAETLMVSDLIELGPLRPSDVDDGRNSIEVDTYSLLRTVLEAGHGPAYNVELDLSIAGLSNVRARLVGGYGYERSPWLTIDTAGDVILRTALTRVYLEASTSAALSQVASVRLPVYAELASAEAQITEIDCDPASEEMGVKVAVTPSLGTVAIADVGLEGFADLSVEPSLQNALLVRTALVQVSAFSENSLGGMQPQEVAFSMQEIEDGARKEVGTNDLAQGIARSLSEDLELEVTMLGLTLAPARSGVATATTAALTRIAPLLDGVLNQIENAAGLKLGVAEVHINRLRCGRPMLIG